MSRARNIGLSVVLFIALAHRRIVGEFVGAKHAGSAC